MERPSAAKAYHPGDGPQSIPGQPVVTSRSTRFGGYEERCHALTLRYSFSISRREPHGAFRGRDEKNQAVLVGFPVVPQREVTGDLGRPDLRITLQQLLEVIQGALTAVKQAPGRLAALRRSADRLSQSALNVRDSRS